MTPIVKICGLSTPATLEAALDAGADMVGFVFFPEEPPPCRLGDSARARDPGAGTGEDRCAQRRCRRRCALAHCRRAGARSSATARARNSGAGQADRRTYRPPDDEGDRRRSARGFRRRPALRWRRRRPAHRRQAAKGRGAAGRQRTSLRLEPGAGLSSSAVHGCSRAGSTRRRSRRRSRRAAPAASMSPLASSARPG